MRLAQDLPQRQYRWLGRWAAWRPLRKATESSWGEGHQGYPVLFTATTTPNVELSMKDDGRRKCNNFSCLCIHFYKVLYST